MKSMFEYVRVLQEEGRLFVTKLRTPKKINMTEYLRILRMQKIISEDTKIFEMFARS